MGNRKVSITLARYNPLVRVYYLRRRTMHSHTYRRKPELETMTERCISKSSSYAKIKPRLEVLRPLSFQLLVHQRPRISFTESALFRHQPAFLRFQCMSLMHDGIDAASFKRGNRSLRENGRIHAVALGIPVGCGTGTVMFQRIPSMAKRLCKKKL